MLWRVVTPVFPPLYTQQGRQTILQKKGTLKKVKILPSLFLHAVLPIPAPHLPFSSIAACPLPPADPGVSRDSRVTLLQLDYSWHQAQPETAAVTADKSPSPPSVSRLLGSTLGDRVGHCCHTSWLRLD